MIGFTKEEIVELANQWIDENQQWADSVVIQAAQQAGTNPFEQLEACSLANRRSLLDFPHHWASFFHSFFHFFDKISAFT